MTLAEVFCAPDVFEHALSAPRRGRGGAVAAGDGAITAAEHEAGARKMFDKMDKDHNGKLSAAEIQAGHEKMLTAGDE